MAFMFSVRRKKRSVLRTQYLVPVLVILTVMLSRSIAEEPPFHLGHRAADDLPGLAPEELATPQQQALLTALSGDPYGHRAADHKRAGCTMHIRSHAIPSYTPHYGGYWVGGGVPLVGDNPTLEEGTFGWDYFGMTFRKRVALNWSHGRRHQGGFGAYRTDGPRLHKR